MRWGSVAVAVAACYQPTAPEGALCGSGAACPSGQQCFGDRCFSHPPADGGADAASDAASPNDLDGDGVANDVDNCPTIANADQRDFDADGIGDVCDHCPHLASATDPDADGDGVGDACDPRPGIAGDHIALFDGFY